MVCSLSLPTAYCLLPTMPCTHRALQNVDHGTVRIWMHRRLQQYITYCKHIHIAGLIVCLIRTHNTTLLLSLVPSCVYLQACLAPCTNLQTLSRFRADHGNPGNDARWKVKRSEHRLKPDTKTIPFQTQLYLRGIRLSLTLLARRSPNTFRGFVANRQPRRRKDKPMVRFGGLSPNNRLISPSDPKAE